jgi:hypothetical protein
LAFSASISAIPNNFPGLSLFPGENPFKTPQMTSLVENSSAPFFLDLTSYMDLEKLDKLDDQIKEAIALRAAVGEL